MVASHHAPPLAGRRVHSPAASPETPPSTAASPVGSVPPEHCQLLQLPPHILDLDVMCEKEKQNNKKTQKLEPGHKATQQPSNYGYW